MKMNDDNDDDKKSSKTMSFDLDDVNSVKVIVNNLPEYRDARLFQVQCMRIAIKKFIKENEK